MGLFSRFHSDGSGDRPTGLRRWVIPTGRRDQDLDQIKQAAAADFAEMEEEDRKYFRQDGPGSVEDDL
jgi:hypothetical protein